MEERTGKWKQNCHHSKNCKHLPFGNDSFHYNVFYLHKMHRRSIEHLDFDSNTQSLVSIRSFHELEHAHCTHQTNKHINKSICYKRPNGILDFSPTNHERKWHAFAKLGQLTVTCVQISWQVAQWMFIYVYVRVNFTPTRSKQTEIVDIVSSQLHTPLHNGLLLIEKKLNRDKRKSSNQPARISHFNFMLCCAVSSVLYLHHRPFQNHHRDHRRGSFNRLSQTEKSLIVSWLLFSISTFQIWAFEAFNDRRSTEIRVLDLISHHLIGIMGQSLWH